MRRALAGVAILAVAVIAHWSPVGTSAAVQAADVARPELTRANRGSARSIPTTTSSSTTTSTTPAPSTTSTTSAHTSSNPVAKREHPAAGRSFAVRVTCYGPPAFPRGQHTATGAPVGPGSLAVDPGVIRLGSTVELAGLGTFTANDTGGAVRGPHVDLWRPSCAGWPNPTVTATILSRTP